VYFDASEHVSSVQPHTFDLRDLTKTMGQRRERPVPSVSQPAPPASPRTQAPVVAVQTDQTPAPKRPASELMGKRQADVTRLLGKPSLISNGTWYFDTPRGSLRLAFSDDVVTDVQPPTLDLTVITERPEVAPAVSTPAAPPKRPSGAVAQCGDGLYVYVSTGSKTCAGHGGVKEWFVKQ
jgi:Protein of unknown function (DUF3761)